jgi:hypothetical protein
MTLREYLIKRILSLESRSDNRVHVLDGLVDALSVVLRLDSVAQLQRFVDSGGRSTWYSRAEAAEFGSEIDLLVSVWSEIAPQPSDCHGCHRSVSPSGIREGRWRYVD